MNNLALFVTHNIFLTKEQIESIIKRNTLDAIGHCVPVWINAKTGKTTEPACEIFCNYKIHNIKNEKPKIIKIPKKGYEIFLPQCDSWKPPKEIDYEKISNLSSEERQVLTIKRDEWWFSNPKPFCEKDLKSGYVRFEIKDTNQKIYKKNYSSQHIIEIANLDRLNKSLTV